MNNKDKSINTIDRALDRILDEYIANNNDIQPTITPSRIYLLLDVSGSMAGNKIKQAQIGSKRFASDVVKKGYFIGLIDFSDYARYLSAPSQSLIDFDRIVNGLGIGGSTNMAMALDIATSELSKIYGKRIICVVTDGIPNNPAEALQIAQEAKNLGIEIIAIGTQDANQDFLSKLVSDQNQAHIVNDNQLNEGISNMANLLPEPHNK